MKPISVMDQETKTIVSNIQQAVWKLKSARELLKDIDGMEDHIHDIQCTIDDLEQEIEEIWSLENL